MEWPTKCTCPHSAIACQCPFIPLVQILSSYTEVDTDTTLGQPQMRAFSLIVRPHHSRGLTEISPGFLGEFRVDAHCEVRDEESRQFQPLPLN